MTRTAIERSVPSGAETRFSFGSLLIDSALLLDYCYIRWVETTPLDRDPSSYHPEWQPSSQMRL